MNIFVLSKDPVQAAQMQCDQHVVKMPLETAQMLCAAFDGTAPYRRTHTRHPCTVWARTSRENFDWLVEHGLALCDEYTYRFKKQHSSREVIEWCRDHADEIDFPETGPTRPPRAMPSKYRRGNTVSSYRRFYIGDKSRFARWSHRRPPPRWYREKRHPI